MFQKVMASIGSGGAVVDATIADRGVRPGGVLPGQVDLVGGRVDQAVESLSVSMLAKVEVTDERGRGGVVDLPFQTLRLGGSATVRPGERQTVPFRMTVPWEVPITTVAGQQLAGMAVGLQTTVEIANTVADPQDVDAVIVEPLPAQQRILDALGRMGYRFTTAALRKDQVRGVEQQLPFHQEIRFAPPPQLAAMFEQVALTFLARQQDLQVVLDVTRVARYGKGGGLGAVTQTEVGMFVMAHDNLAHNWEQQLTGWLGEVARPRGIFG